MSHQPQIPDIFLISPWDIRTTLLSADPQLMLVVDVVETAMVCQLMAYSIFVNNITRVRLGHPCQMGVYRREG